MQYLFFSVLFIFDNGFYYNTIVDFFNLPMKVDTIVNLDNLKKISYLSNALYRILFIFGISLLYFYCYFLFNF